MDNFKLTNALSDVQIQTLLVIFSAPDPKVALASANGNDKMQAALSVLIQKGLVKQIDVGVIATDAGIEMLDSVAAVDKKGERTEFGNDEMDKAVKLSSPAAQTESVWPLINSVSQLS